MAMSIGLACFYWYVLFFIGVSMVLLVFAAVVACCSIVLAMALAPLFIGMPRCFINLSIALPFFHCLSRVHYFCDGLGLSWFCLLFWLGFHCFGYCIGLSFHCFVYGVGLSFHGFVYGFGSPTG